MANDLSNISNILKGLLNRDVREQIDQNERLSNMLKAEVQPSIAEIARDQQQQLNALFAQPQRPLFTVAEQAGLGAANNPLWQQQAGLANQQSSAVDRLSFERLQQAMSSMNEQAYSMQTPLVMSQQALEAMARMQGADATMKTTDLRIFEDIQVMCPEHDRACELQRYSTTPQWRCPMRACTFRLDLNPQIQDGILTAFMTLNEVRFVARDQGKQVTVPMCPLCASTLNLGQGGDWNCVTCRFKISGGYLDQYRGTSNNVSRGLEGAGLGMQAITEIRREKTDIDRMLAEARSQIVTKMAFRVSNWGRDEFEILRDILWEGFKESESTGKTLLSLMVNNADALREMVQVRKQARVPAVAGARAITFEDEDIT